MIEKKPLTAVGSTSTERERRDAFGAVFAASPIPMDERLANLGLYMKRQDLSRLLFIHEIYQKVVDVHGVVMEFGVRWGQNLALFTALRGIYEPYNFNRKLIGFDTFEGFPGVSPEDGKGDFIKEGAYGVGDDYEAHLRAVLEFHEAECPIAHKTKFELVRGDASQTVPEYLVKHPETIVALAYFDFDLYAPTRACLEALQPHLTKGSVLVFDELNVSDRASTPSPRHSGQVANLSR